MPRSRPVDYPQVHPPTAQPYQGLAPPHNAFADPDRFSWQNSSTDLVSPSHIAEQELEAGISGDKEENRHSTVPPLPVLPDHLEGSERQDNKYREFAQDKVDQSSRQDIPVHSPARTEVAQQYYQQIPQQQVYQFRPDIPRHLQEQNHHLQPQLQTDLQRQPPEPPLSYEASQAQIASQHPLNPHTRMQEQPRYPGHYDGSQLQTSARALLMHNSHQLAQLDHHESQDEKPEHQIQMTNPADPTQLSQQVPSVRVHRPAQQITTSQPPRPTAVYIGPDVHPLSPTSPTITSPTHLTRGHTFPSSIPNDTSQMSSFPQVTSFNPPSPRRTGGTWHTSLLSCSNPAICLPALTCPCIIYGRTQYRLSQKSSNKDATNMLGYSAINGSCLAWSVLCGINVLLTAIQHRRVRKTYEMDEGSGNAAGDCVRSLCCCCCVIALDEKEVKAREERKLGGKEGMVERSYVSPEGMMYSPPPR